jgi:serine protease AprX
LTSKKVIIVVALLSAYFFALSVSTQAADKIRIRPAALQQDSIKVWVYFSDKGVGSVPLSKKTAVKDKAMVRRALRGQIANFDDYDREVNPAYIEQVASLVKRVANQSRWLNAVSAWATASSLDRLEQLPFVDSVKEVAVFYRKPEPVNNESAQGLLKPESPYPPDYGPSFTQAAQIEVDALHTHGLTGEGVTILNLDSGFKVSHPAFEQTKIDSTWDFINGDVNVEDPSDPAEGPGRISQMFHGTATLSEIGGYDYGEMIGVAYGANFLLAKTEVTGSETKQEEDNWVAGIEWGERLGADVTTSSLGYINWYTWEDMDGHTAACTQAASIAAQHGLIVVNAVGNEGRTSLHPTLISPADGEQVIACGAVDLAGAIASFSSNGPTFDGRIKPDLCAMGISCRIANRDNDYVNGNGTSYSTPLVAGVCALLLQAHPNWGYADLYEALTHTATKAGEPDTVYGYGIVRGYQALNYGIGSDTAVAQVIAAPNPFISSVDFLFPLSTTGEATYRIYTVGGEKVAEQTRDYSAPTDGKALTYRITWNGRNSDGEQVAPGVYVVYFKSPGVETTLKIFRKSDGPTF